MREISLSKFFKNIRPFFLNEIFLKLKVFKYCKYFSHLIECGALNTKCIKINF
jgi:hypothetical protein